MHPSTALAFAAATLILLAIPGPNVALIVANSLKHGTRYGLATVAGTTLAMVPQLVFAITGAGALLAASAAWFEALRWAGVAYLFYLAVQAWRASGGHGAIEPQPRSLRGIVLRGFLVSLTNPKTLLFYGAFLPQFVDPQAEPTGQLLTLAALFVVLAILVDGGWAIFAGRARALIAAHGRWLNRLSAACFAAAGVGLSLARRA